MVNQDIIHYLSRQRKYKYTNEQLRDMCIRRGYDKEEIDEALNYSSSPKKVQQPKEEDYPEPEPIQHNIPEIVPEPKEEDSEPKAKSNSPEEELHDLPSGESPKPHRHMGWIPIVIVLIIAAGGYAYFFVPLCGNGAIDLGETVENCCLDIGCPGEQSCQENACIDPTCGECQYIVSHKCEDYECCSNSACQDSMKCENHICAQITCGECEYAANYTCVKNESCTAESRNSTGQYSNNTTQCGECQYLKNNTCKPYLCCDDDYCDDHNPSTIDICLKPGTLNASCVNTPRQTCQKDSDCDDGNASTKDICIGGTYCSTIVITECKDNDGCCPELCTYFDDNDCRQEMRQCSGINSFMDEAEDDCSLANLTYSFSAEKDGLVYDFDAYYELRGLDENDDCLFYTKYINVKLDYTYNLTQTKLAQNMTQLEIDDEIDDLEDDFEHDYEGKYKICRYPIDDLLDVLQAMKDDDYLVPADEEDDYDCDGSFY